METQAGRREPVNATQTLVPDLLELTKPRITLMVLVTTAAGFWLGASSIEWMPFCGTLLGTALIASGASCLNQVIEVRTDALMDRTRHRPLAAGRMERRQGAAFGLLLSVAGTLLLAFAANRLTAELGVLTLVLYTAVYTPMKRVNSLCTVVGAVPGAIPPMMGWTAATNQLTIEAWVLFGILFFWQMPHFLAIAWIYREDYEKGLQPMLPVHDQQGSATARQMLLYSLGLLPVSLLPSILGMSAPSYFWGALVLGLIFLGSAAYTAQVRNEAAARILLRVSVIYLPALLLLLSSTKALDG
jgi:protoheme IX farnesyltransferase